MHSPDHPSPATASPGDGEVWVLVVDDEPGERGTLSSVLLQKGYQVEVAATGQEALEKTRGRFFHAAILDVRLPDLNGTELLSRLKEIHPDTAALMVTGYASLQTSIRAINSGASAYVLKPLDLDHLFTALDQALAQQRTRFENRRQLSQSSERIRELESREAELMDRVRRLEQEVSALRGAGR